MAITVNKRFWTEFIYIYHSLPSLWNTKDENYNNRESRSIAWNKLVEKLQEVEPDANQDSVKRKINTFRSNFNREVRKIRLTQKEQPAEEYNPTLWYFDHLSFLLNHEKYNSNGVLLERHYAEETTLMGLSNATSEMVENDDVDTEAIRQGAVTDNDQKSHFEKTLTDKSMLRLGFNKSNSCDILPEMEQKPLIEYISHTESLQNEPTVPSEESIKETQNISLEKLTSSLKNIDNSAESERTHTFAQTIRSNVKKSKLRLKSQDPYNRHQRNNFITSDEAAIYGQAWTCGFRKLNPQQKLFAKKAIDDILILGQLKALKLNTVQISATLFEDQG